MASQVGEYEGYQAYAGLIRWIAWRYRRQRGWMSEADLREYGWIGVLKAYRSYDSSRGGRFATHVGFMVHYEILDAIGQYGQMIRVPASGQKRGFVPPRRSDDYDIGAIIDRPDGCHVEDADQVEAVLGRLLPRERVIIERYFGLFGEPETLAEIGKDLGITRERVRQIVGCVLDRIRTRDLPSLPSFARKR